MSAGAHFDMEAAAAIDGESSHMQAATKRKKTAATRQ